MTSGRGFTLVEMLITLVVVAILAAIAIPTYNDSVRKSRRSDATSALASIQQTQERWRNNHASYASADELGLPKDSPGGYYRLTLDSADAVGYVLTATANDGTSQASDGDCRRMSVRLAAGSLAYAGCGSCDSFTYSATQACWAH